MSYYLSLFSEPLAPSSGSDYARTLVVTTKNPAERLNDLLAKFVDVVDNAASNEVFSTIFKDRQLQRLTTLDSKLRRKNQALERQCIFPAFWSHSPDDNLDKIQTDKPCNALARIVKGTSSKI